jgi:hypothetical protein
LFLGDRRNNRIQGQFLTWKNDEQVAALHTQFWPHGIVSKYCSVKLILELSVQIKNIPEIE